MGYAHHTFSDRNDVKSTALDALALIFSMVAAILGIVPVPASRQKDEGTVYFNKMGENIRDSRRVLLSPDTDIFSKGIIFRTFAMGTAYG
jgi:hypothetical protein